MNIYLLKAILSLADFMGKKLIFNWQPPSVGKHLENIKYGNHKAQVLDVLVPPSEPPFPVVVYIHGGGFLAGSKESYTRICRILASKGYLTVNLNYRLAPAHNFPSQLHDVAAALKWVVNHASEHGGDTSRIFLAGDSAGAYLAMWYATALHKQELFSAFKITNTLPCSTLKGIILFYGVYDLEAVRTSGFPFLKLIIDFLGRDVNLHSERLRLSSPLRHLKSSLPPVFICAGERDRLFSQSRALETALKEQGVPHTTLFFPRFAYPGAHHAFLNFYYKRCSKIAMDEVITFLNAASNNNPPSVRNKGLAYASPTERKLQP